MIEEYKTLISGMDKAAKALKELNDKNIPVLWRPFHELDGGWFWWSRGGAENFILAAIANRTNPVGINSVCFRCRP